MINTSNRQRRPICWVDMDGVLVDLYNHAAIIHDVTHYNSMTKAEWESFFNDSDAYQLFRDVPAFKNTNSLLKIIKYYAGDFNILSSPLSFDKEGSIRGKSEWIKNHITVQPNEIVFDHEKWKFATQPDGTPNVLIDDWKGNTVPWQAAGGIAIKFQNDEDDVSELIAILEKIYPTLNTTTISQETQWIPETFTN